MKTYFKLAWRNIWRNKVRTLLSVGAIALVAYIPSTMLRSLQQGTYANMMSNMLNTNIGHIQILHKDFWRERDINMAFQIKDTNALIKDISAIENILPRIESFALASIESVTKPVMVFGVDPEKEKSFSKLHEKIIDGKYLEDGVIVNKDFAKKMRLNVGDTIAMIGYGYHGSSAVDLFRITGIVNLVIPGVGLAIMNFNQASEFFSTNNKATNYLVQLNHPEIALDKTDSLLTSGINLPNIDVRDWKSLVPEFVEQKKFDDAVSLLITGVLYIIVCFGLFGTVLMMTQERRKEFGIMMAIGMNKTKMAIIAFFETTLISFTGVFAGFIITFPILAYLYNHPIKMIGEAGEAFEKLGYEPVINFSFNASIFIDQIPIILALSFLVSIYPFYKILYTNISKSIRD